MKLGENRSTRKNQRIRSGEALEKREKPKGGFNPEQHMTQADWEKAADYLSRCAERHNTGDALVLWMQQHHLNPEKFWQGLQSGPVADWFKTLGSTGGQDKIVQAIHDDSLSDVPEYLLEELFHRVETRDLFPQHELTPSTKDLANLLGILQVNRDLWHTENVVRTLYLMKHFLRTDTTLHLLPEERTRFLNQWDEVWGAGNLEDIIPDKLVCMLARIRVIDPELFKIVRLDGTFWYRALDWLEELREANDVKSIFDFSFHLYLLSAENVRIDEQGKLVIEKKTQHFETMPLPLRDIA